MEVYKKINKCRVSIKNTTLKKAGYNDYSNYSYFTPEQVDELVFKACQENDLFDRFDLVRNELGIDGILTIVDLDSGKSETFTMASDIPVLKATNITQQLGGAMTYTERYLKMSVFGIKDNTLDFDTPQKQAKSNNQTSKKDKEVTVWLTEDQLNKALVSGIKGIEATLKAYDFNNGKAMKKEYRTSLVNKLEELKKD